jgi:hypothetical protein
LDAGPERLAFFFFALGQWWWCWCLGGFDLDAWGCACRIGERVAVMNRNAHKKHFLQASMWYVALCNANHYTTNNISSHAYKKPACITQG